MHAWTFDAIGTAWQIDTHVPLGSDVRAAVLDRIDAFDRVWSRFRPDSLVNQMAARAGTFDLPGESLDLLAFYAELHEVTGGAVDPLVGQTLADLGYDAEYSLVRQTDAAFEPHGWFDDVFSGVLAVDVGLDAASAPTAITTQSPVLIDVGAAGKGLLVDLVAEMVEANHYFTVDASGDLLHGGTAPIRVALEHPADPTRAIGVAVVEPEDALCASATNRRSWGDGLHHVIDARTARPTDDVVATWVVSPQSCMHADGLATAHFFADPPMTAALMERFDHQYVRMHADGHVEWSTDFPGEIFR